MDKTLIKGLTLLEALANSEESRGVSSLARELDLSKSNVHRILLTLQSKDYVRRVDINSTYELTPKIWELGAKVRGRLSLTRVSARHLTALSGTTGESVHLSILDGGDVVYIDKIEGTHPIAAYTRVGGRAPAYCVATGKAMLAHVPDEMLESTVPQLAIFSRTTLSSYPALRKELAQIRAQGYAINRGEWREDVFGIAAPVMDVRGKVIGAVGISGPATRYKPKQIRTYTEEVVTTARAISRELGHNFSD
ncbi:IclR family transcriptional regulator [Chachezhania sediminis]|uniref:IclR family transcriptional regulator n=1 Tax=Chachezhania sediminis TaxID=2599291 RepID=UPI00131AC837|nr:IclR family transcriptional regulator [Chachezhania sediminis]